MSFGLNGIDNSQALNSIYQNNASSLSNAGSAGSGDMQQRVQSNGSPFENSSQQQQGSSGSKGQSGSNSNNKILEAAQKILSMIPLIGPALSSILSALASSGGPNSSSQGSS